MSIFTSKKAVRLSLITHLSFSDRRKCTSADLSTALSPPPIFLYPGGGKQQCEAGGRCRLQPG